MQNPVRMHCALFTTVLICLSASAADKPTSVISTDASITALVLALGAGDKLVAVDVTSQLPETFSNLPRVGYHRALSAEGLLSLNPDLMLVSEHAGPPEVLRTLESLGIDIQRVPAPLSPRELAANVSRIADLLNASAAADEVLQQIRVAGQNLETQALQKPGMILLRENAGVLRLAGAGTAGNALISLLGGTNLADFEGYRSFSQEAVLAINPAYLLVAVSDEQLQAGEEAWLAAYPLLMHLQAVGSKQWAAIPADALVGGLSLATLQEAQVLLKRFSKVLLATP
ncbi:MAG: ABC transporter substrate-binding protein [Congregibacter sp.]|nr:ABC transporter substrate-binding protein [Congregibacter sp.]